MLSDVVKNGQIARSEPLALDAIEVVRPDPLASSEARRDVEGVAVACSAGEELMPSPLEPVDAISFYVLCLFVVGLS